MATWKTRDGRKLNIAEMETDHIKNCIAMLRRKGLCSTDEFHDSWRFVSSCQGEMASYYAEQQASGMHPSRAIDAFEAELARRRATAQQPG